MAGKEVAEARAQLTGTGSTAGVIAVADNSIFFPGTSAWLSDGTPANSREVLILNRISTTQLTIRVKNPQPTNEDGFRAVGPRYGVSDASSFTVAYALIMPRQYAPNDYVG